MATIRIQHANNPSMPIPERRHGRRKTDAKPVVIQDRRREDTETVIVEPDTVAEKPAAVIEAKNDWRQSLYVIIAILLLFATYSIVRAFARPKMPATNTYVVPAGGTATYYGPGPGTNAAIVPYPAGSEEPPSPFPIPALPFSDVPETHPAYREIYALYQKGVLAGYESGTFRPDTAITRAEVARLLTLATETPTVVPGTQFTDLNPPTPGVTPEVYTSFTPYVYTATSRGWMRPATPTTFAPWENATTRDALSALRAATRRGTPSTLTAPMTRAEFARELARAIGLV